MKYGLILAAAMVGACTNALADDVGPYIYGSLGKAESSVDKSAVDSVVQSSLGVSGVTSNASSNPTSYKLNFGYLFTPTLGVEVGFAQTSDYKYNATAPVIVSASEKLQVWDVVVAGDLPVANNFAFTFRGGFANVRANGSGAAANFSGSKSQVTGGVGVKYSFDRNLSVRADWDGFKAPDGAKLGQVNLLTIGLGYKF